MQHVKLHSINIIESKLSFLSMWLITQLCIYKLYLSLLIQNGAECIQMAMVYELKLNQLLNCINKSFPKETRAELAGPEDSMQVYRRWGPPRMPI